MNNKRKSKKHYHKSRKIVISLITYFAISGVLLISFGEEQRMRNLELIRSYTSTFSRNDDEFYDYIEVKSLREDHLALGIILLVCTMTFIFMDSRGLFLDRPKITMTKKVKPDQS